MEDKGIERNSMIGMFLLMAMLMVYMFLNKETPPPTQTTKPVAKAAKNALSPAGQIAAVSDSAVQARTFTVENEDLKIDFSTKGGSIQKVELKKYRSYDYKPLILLDENSVKYGLKLKTSSGETDIKNLVFQSDNQTVKTDKKDSVIVRFTGQLPNGQQIEQIYVVKGKGYEIAYGVKSNSALAGNATLQWANKIKQTENDIAQNRKEAKINYLISKDEEFDELNSQSSDTEELSEPIKWFSFKQLYFNSGLLSTKQDFSSLKLKSDLNEADSSYVKSFEAEAVIPAAALDNGLKYYFGPNEFSTVKPVGVDYHKNVYLGYDLVKPINRFIFVPMFNFFEKFITNYGLLIILVVIALKAVLTPLVYKSYTSMAKMRVLAPEIELIKEKVGDDQVKLQQEQMKLYQQVGVSPLSGCVPVLLQMPILMSVFFLFPNMIMFRQKEFLWSKDLSTYDAPLSWATNIPVIGNHLSLFALFYLISTLIYTYYNNQTTPAQPGPIDMKKLSYVFPVVFFFVLNSFPAALNFYYFVSNIVTIIQQLIIRKFVDEDKIKAVLEENRKKFKSNPTTAKKSKFSSFLEKSMQAAEEAKKQQEAQKKKKK